MNIMHFMWIDLITELLLIAICPAVTFVCRWKEHLFALLASHCDTSLVLKTYHHAKAIPFV